MDLEVNPGKRLYRLDLPNVHVEGVYTETMTISGEKFESTTAKSWVTGSELEQGFMLLGERSYDPDSGVITGGDSFDASQATDKGLRGLAVQTTKGLEPGFWPSVVFTVSWTLRLGESPGRLLLEPEELYADWIPEGRTEQETVLSVISVTDRSMDMVFSTELNADLKISEDGLSAKTFVPERQAIVFLEARDYGAWAKLAATATIVTGKGETEIEGVYEALGTPFVTLPQDDDNNRIADAWQRQHGVEGGGIDDNDSEPKSDSMGDGLSLYEEYRGFYIQGQHQRLDPEIKDLFVWDRDGLVQDSHLATAASPLAIHYMWPSEMSVDTESDNYRVINPNHDRFHLVDQHGIVVIHATPSEKKWGFCHGACLSPGTAEPFVSVYVGNIRQALIKRLSNHEQEIVDKLGHPVDILFVGDTNIEARPRPLLGQVAHHRSLAIGNEMHISFDISKLSHAHRYLFHLPRHPGYGHDVVHVVLVLHQHEHSSQDILHQILGAETDDNPRDPCASQKRFDVDSSLVQDGDDRDHQDEGVDRVLDDARHSPTPLDALGSTQLTPLDDHAIRSRRQA